MFKESKVSRRECTLYISEIVDAYNYLKFYLSLPGGVYFYFPIFDTEGHKKRLKRILNNKFTVLWIETRSAKRKHQKSSKQFYYNQSHFYYYKDSMLYEFPLEEDHIETINDFLISTEKKLTKG